MKAWILVLAMTGLLSAAGAGAVDDIGAHVVTKVPPKYPADAARAGISGTVVLVITVTATGAVESILVERSSGNRSLDTAAIDAANEWTYAPSIEHGKAVRGRVRVPVDFTMGDEDEPVRAAVAHLAPRLRVPVVTPDADGTLPRFIQDPLSLEADGVAATMALLESQATPIDLPDLPADIALYTLTGENGETRWEVYTGEMPHAPTLVRTRLTTDGKHGFSVTRVLCEAKDAEACKRFLGHVQRSGRQRAVPLKTPEAGGAGSKGAVPGG